MEDRTYATTAFSPREIQHRYGPGVHLLDDPLSLTLLARLSSPEAGQPEVLHLVRKLYHTLAQIVIAAEFPRAELKVATRMHKSEPRAVWSGLGIRRATPVVTAGVARAGTVPSQICYELLNEVLDPAGVRQDHLFMSRLVDSSGHVTGAGFHEAKIGGSVDGRILLVPDPMGATGGSMSEVISHYKDKVDGRMVKAVAMNLIVTPEYLRRLRVDHPDLVVYAFRVDRGLSDPDILDTIPGTHVERERGLDDHQYIIPGAGGLGEVLNNAWV
ncbi:MAG: uracil phosphoribosyltransferase [Deltaproteobacteria bacterium]|nr:uracil phosphoribosyltransferase [Deltaproteobacteria bacterium]